MCGSHLERVTYAAECISIVRCVWEKRMVDKMIGRLGESSAHL